MPSARRLGNGSARNDDCEPDHEQGTRRSARAPRRCCPSLARSRRSRNRLIRLFLSPEHRRAADLIAGWMNDGRMSVSEDALGTVRGHWRPQGESGNRRLLIGSHIDTVIDAGRYDGPLGVVMGILAVEHLAARKAKLPFAIDVLAFGDEEGSRFRSTLASSSACAGIFDKASLAFPDRNGVTLAQAIEAYGKNVSDIPKAAYAREDAAAYIEAAYRAGTRARSRKSSARRGHGASSVKAGYGSWCSARPAMPEPCRC